MPDSYLDNEISKWSNLIQEAQIEALEGFVKEWTSRTIHFSERNGIRTKEQVHEHMKRFAKEYLKLLKEKEGK